MDSGGGEVSVATLKGLLQREGPLHGLVAWCRLSGGGLCWSGEAGLGWATGPDRLHGLGLGLGSLAPGVILGSAWCDQRGHQSKTFILEAGAASLAMPTAVYIHVVGSDSSELAVAAVALTEWNCSHPSCHSASKNISCLF